MSRFAGDRIAVGKAEEDGDARASPTDDNAAYDDSSPANEIFIFAWILTGQ